MASLTQIEHRNQDATCYVGNLDPQCTEQMIMELFTQVGTSPIGAHAKGQNDTTAQRLWIRRVH